MLCTCGTFPVGDGTFLPLSGNDSFPIVTLSFSPLNTSPKNPENFICLSYHTLCSETVHVKLKWRAIHCQERYERGPDEMIWNRMTLSSTNSVYRIERLNALHRKISVRFGYFLTLCN